MQNYGRTIEWQHAKNVVDGLKNHTASRGTANGADRKRENQMARTNKAEKQDWSKMLNVDGLAEDVTPENYYRLFRAFAMHHAKHVEDVGTTINPIDDPQQFGAWQAYIKTKKIKTQRMRSVGQTAAITFDKVQRVLHGYQVPAKFPSDFDAQAEWVFDKTAGDVFVERQAAARKAAADFEHNKPPLNLKFKTTKGETNHAKNT